MVLLVLMLLGLLIAVSSLAMTIRNLDAFVPPSETTSNPPRDELVSVCIPARNEEENIEACIRSVLSNDHPIEVLVYDDESDDRTSEILSKLCEEDERVRCVETVRMPAGWSGKQHACDRMGRAALGRWVLFTDADVRFQSDAVAHAVNFAKESDAALVSTFPRQVCGSLGELLQVPMMFFILLAYLPMRMMRTTDQPSASAGCGQFLLADRLSYLRTGGHAAFRASMHDGVKMPRSFRSIGLKTDLFDGTNLVSVRMYKGFSESWRGFAKNAYEGLGSVSLLSFLTVMHGVGHSLAWIVAPIALWAGSPLVAGIGLAAIALNIVQRALLCRRFKHPIWLAFLHPISIALMTLVQWYSLLLHLQKGRSWRGRELVELTGEHVILVNEDDQEVGTAEKIVTHRDGGQLHRAFSVFLIDGNNRIMLQQRASVKYHFGDRWTNTCCGHPRPGEQIENAAKRRLVEEMGIETDLTHAGTFMYRADDLGSGLTEHEIDHVFLGEYSSDPLPRADEVANWRWVNAQELEDEMQSHPERFTPWLKFAWDQIRPKLKPDEANHGAYRV